MINKLNKIYTDAFERELENRAGEGYYVINEATGKRYEGAGFYLCGFNWISFKLKGKENRELKKTLEREGVRVGRAYPSGFSFSLPESIGHGNGYYEIERVAYSKVCDYLDSEGYNVYHYSNLD